jgi:AcrR family transcriptional regulator
MRKLTRSDDTAPRLTKGERTRERILQAAENTFAKLGYERATLREVARVTRIHQPGIYNYFGTKRDLYKATLDRMLHPLVDVLDEITTLPAEDRVTAAPILVDLLVSNRNISPLLVRAYLSTNQTERGVAVSWMKRIISHGVRRSRGHSKNPHSIDETLKDMAVLNTWLGYFWTAPLIESLTGKKITDEGLLKSQKALLIFLASTV